MLSQNNNLFDNMEDQHLLPGTSNDNTVQENFSETGESQLAVFPSNVVQERLRHFGINNEEINQILNQHLRFKLAAILTASKDYMAQCGRSKFTIEDFNKGLISCGQNPVKKYNILPTAKKKSRQKRKENEQFETVAHLIYIKEFWVNGESPFHTTLNDLPDELQNYFNALQEVLFLNDEKTSIILNDLQKNKNIFQLVPYLVNFFCDCMINFEVDFLKISILMRFASALLRNKHLYFGQDSYLNSMSCALLKYLAADLLHSDQGIDCWLLKDNAANLLAIILNRSKDLQLFFEAIQFMETILSFSNPFNSHYGALVALNAIGVPAILLLLPSYNHRFQEHVNMTVHSSYEGEIDFQMVKGQVVRSYYLLVDYFFKNEYKRHGTQPLSSDDFFSDYLKDVKVFPVISQLSFSDFFGETLHPSFPFLNCASRSFFRKKHKLSLKKTGKI